MRMLTEKNKKLMIVEDSMDIQLILKDLFTGEGYDVACASNGQEALDLLKSLEDLPQLILLDLMMPVMDGFQFRDEQTKDSRFSKIPVFIMSADTNIQTKKIKTAATQAFKKPVDIDQLLEATRRHYGSWWIEILKK